MSAVLKHELNHPMLTGTKRSFICVWEIFIPFLSVSSIFFLKGNRDYNCFLAGRYVYWLFFWLKVIKS